MMCASLSCAAVTACDNAHDLEAQVHQPGQLQKRVAHEKTLESGDFGNHIDGDYSGMSHQKGFILAL